MEGTRTCRARRGREDLERRRTTERFACVPPQPRGHRAGRCAGKVHTYCHACARPEILEIGAAEGVLALLLARDKERVYALERNERRHTEALHLQALWRERGLHVDRCEMVRADLRERIDLLDLVDTVVAVRSIYYLEEDIVPVFEQIARKFPNVLLCGNADRARYFELTGGKGPPRKGFGPYSRYAGFEGMASLLEGVGYRIVNSVKEGDAIVVGRKDVP